MKNFKRVISAVIALALSASTLVAVSASKFSDVDSTNSYAEAIEALTALDIVHGYEEDGAVIFKPDGDITRAEAATMIVGALNMTKDAQAAAGTSKFTDVNEKASWATGYVNVGVAQGFINGMDDTTFAPQENVTYAQMCVMLTLITGYGDYAKAYGGYPTGYTTIAAQTGINKGVAVAADTALKRGQVAQMLYNAMVTPVLGVAKYSLQGNEYAVSDGAEVAFKTILSDKFSAYEAEVSIDATAKTGEEAGKIVVTLTEDAYLDQVKEDGKVEVDDKKATMSDVFDDFGVDAHLFSTGKAILAKDADKKWHLIYFVADEATTEVVNAADYIKKADGGEDLDGEDHKITFGSKDYQINKDKAEVYVNGKKYLSGATVTTANLETVLDAAQGEVKLIDSNDAKGYEKIMVTAYDIAQVQSVAYTNKVTTISVSVLSGIDSKIAGGTKADKITSIKIKDTAVEEGDIDLTVKTAAGEKVALSSIKEDDIIAFAIDPSKTDTTLENLKTLDIIVTDETVSGMVTKIDGTEKVVTINGDDYEAVSWDDISVALKASYTAYLDPFGRIYSVDVVESGAKYAIAEQYSKDYGVQLVLPDGTAKWYEIDLAGDKVDDPDNVTKKADDKTKKVSIADFETYLEGDNGDTKAAAPIDRVVKYEVKSTGKITSITLLKADKKEDIEYKGRTEKLDGKTIIDSTAVLDVQGYKANNLSSYKTFATTAFVDGAKYDGWVISDGTTKAATFVILTKTGDSITPDSRFAVVRKAAVAATSADGDACYSVNVLYDGQEQDLLFDKEPKKLAVGDAFFFTTNNEGLVEDYLPVLTEKFTSLADEKQGAEKIKTFEYDTEKWGFKVDKKSKADYQLVYGIVTDATSKGVELVDATNLVTDDKDPITSATINVDKDADFFGFDSDYVSYRYDVNSEKAESNQYKAIVVGAPAKSVLKSYDTKADSGETIYDLVAKGDGKGLDHLNYALALIVDGDIVEIYTIVQ